MRTYVPDNYDIGKHRYLELLNYCRQYPEWKRKLADCYGIRSATPKAGRAKGVNDPTSRAVESAERYRRLMAPIDQAARATDPALAPHLILNATEGYSFDVLIARAQRPPCGINQFYAARRKFFWILSQIK